MLVSCSYYRRIHEKNFDCGKEKVKCAIVTVAMPSRPNLEALQNGKKKSLEIRKRDNGLWQCCIRDFSGTFSKVD